MAGSVGKVRYGSDFVGIYDSVVWGASQLAAGDGLGGFGFVSDDEGSFASTVDEDGGILAITVDVGDDDNAVLVGPRCKPVNGGAWLEARYKYSNVDCAIFVGFTETLSLTAPVMPAEFATATMTYNGTGGMVGIQYDVDGTTDDFRAVMGDGGAGTGGSSTTGVRSLSTLTADRWFITRVELFMDGSAEVWHSDSGHVDGAGYPAMRLIKKFTAGLTATDLFYPVVMIENRSANARVLEVDYAFGEHGRDWACD
jgi:hypothetical protein